jgi:hypothetical protein
VPEVSLNQDKFTPKTLLALWTDRTHPLAHKGSGLTGTGKGLVRLCSIRMESKRRIRETRNWQGCEPGYQPRIRPWAMRLSSAPSSRVAGKFESNSFPDKMKTKLATRRDGRVAEGARLESVYTLTGIGGSNPSLSAMFSTAWKRLRSVCDHFTAKSRAYQFGMRHRHFRS